MVPRLGSRTHFRVMRSYVVLLALSGLICGRAFGDPAIRIQATPALAEFAKDIVGPLHDEGIEVKLLKEDGNTQVAAALGAGEIDAALLTRPIKIDERVNYPEHHFVEIPLGVHAVAMVVSRLVWEGGVRGLTRDQMARLYESKVRNWKDVGGEDRPLQFFEPAHGRGPWEIFATWLYGDTLKAPGRPMAGRGRWCGYPVRPPVFLRRNLRGGAALIDRTDVFPLAVIDDAGKSIDPTPANIAAGTYPLTRPVIIAFAEEPVTKTKKLVEYLLGAKGQEIVAAHDFVPENVLKPPAP